MTVDSSLLKKLISSINALESHQPMSINGSSYARRPPNPQGAGSERSFTFDNRGAQGSARAQQSHFETMASMQSKFLTTAKLRTTKPFDENDFYTWSFEFELLAQGAQIWMYYDGTYAFPANDSPQVKAHYYNESLMAFTILIRNLTTEEQLSIRPFKNEWAPAQQS
ncbi:unnamed protein product [Closterium sp. NIES-54]